MGSLVSKEYKNSSRFSLFRLDVEMVQFRRVRCSYSGVKGSLSSMK